MNHGIRTMATKLPADAQLDELDTASQSLASGLNALAEGNQKLKQGTERLNSGLELLASSLPASIEQPEGSAQGLANSVKPEVQVIAPVANSGSAFAPNVIPAALWLGASIAAFLVHARVLPRHAQFFGRPAQVAGKMVIPSLVVLAQAMLIWATIVLILKIHVLHIGIFTIALALASLTFLCIVFALTRMFGDAGKAFAMIFLAVQLSSSGGILPVELSGGLFANISPWMPLTWVVHSMKATMFGAYDNGWEYSLTCIAAMGLTALVCASWLGHWRYVKSTSIRPPVDF
jgi:putative membrane protein